MDAVYPIGAGSQWQDNELRYSLRSLAMHAPEVDRVIIVGRAPSWLVGTLNVPHGEGPSICANQLSKMRMALDHVRGGAFIWMNDDFYLLAKQDWRSIGHIPHPTHRPAYYQQCYRKAGEFLFSIGIAPARDHELHVPVRYDAGKVLHLLSILPTFNIAFRTVYFNMHAPISVPMKDVKVHGVRGIMDVWQSFSSSSAAVRNEAFRRKLQELYPDPSPWEVTDR